MDDTSLPKETAYYYPEPYWFAHESGWIKNLLLFFDDVAILLPEYMEGRQYQDDHTLAYPLKERGLLQVIHPEWFVDEDATQPLVDIMAALIESGAFDHLDDQGPLAELSMSRMGYYGSRKAATRVFEALEARGLAAKSGDGVSIPMRRTVRSTFLVVLAQLARGIGAKHHLDLHPVTSNLRMEKAFTSFLNLDPMPFKGHVISSDLELVSVDLSDVPLDDVLRFRDKNRDFHRQYMQNLRSFVATISALDPLERERAIRDRTTELQEQAEGLRRRSVEAWKRPISLAGFSLGITGAAATLASGSGAPVIVGAVAAALSSLLSMVPGSQEPGPYTYLMKARQDFV